MGKSKKSESDGKKAGAKASKSDPSPASLPGMSFEGALEQLESTVARLEEGEMPLEEALELFENGVKLSRQCATTLEAAEKRIEILVADRGDAAGGDGESRTQLFEADDFEEEEEDGAEDDDD